MEIFIADLQEFNQTFFCKPIQLPNLIKQFQQLTINWNINLNFSTSAKVQNKLS
jgi:hypothetical protein